MNDAVALRRTVLSRGNLVIAAFVALLAYFSLATKGFFSVSNFLEILMRVSITAPIALGMMLAIILKGIDLSPGATLGLVGLAVAGLLDAEIGRAHV